MVKLAMIALVIHQGSMRTAWLSISNFEWSIPMLAMYKFQRVCLVKNNFTSILA